MHETVFAARIIEEAKKHGNVEAITVEVGDLAHVPASDLAETLRQMAGADGWNVDVVEKKATIKCSCSYEGEPKILAKEHDNTIFECPKCKDGKLDIIDGDEIILKEIKIKD